MLFPWDLLKEKGLFEINIFLHYISMFLSMYPIIDSFVLSITKLSKHFTRKTVMQFPNLEKWKHSEGIEYIYTLTRKSNTCISWMPLCCMTAEMAIHSWNALFPISRKKRHKNCLPNKKKDPQRKKMAEFSVLSKDDVNLILLLYRLVRSIKMITFYCNNALYKLTSSSINAFCVTSSKPIVVLLVFK